MFTGFCRDILALNYPLIQRKALSTLKSLLKTLLILKTPEITIRLSWSSVQTNVSPRAPIAIIVLLAAQCTAFASGRVAELPVKLRKTKVKKRFFNYLLVHDGDFALIQQRLSKDIWQQLYEFPLIETHRVVNQNEIIEHAKFKEVTQGKPYKLSLHNETALIHKLSHQHIYTHFWIVELMDSLKNGVQIERLKEYAVPVLIANFVEEFSF
jgi:A/G-specific adenine glycosylase